MPNSYWNDQVVMDYFGDGRKQTKKEKEHKETYKHKPENIKFQRGGHANREN